MPEILIDNRKVITRDNITVLQALQAQGIHVPTLCHLDGYDPYTSCMLCVVEDKRGNKLIPSCSVYVEEGMDIESDSPRIQAARKDTIDMLLAEHIGDCRATCSIGCPAGMNIPHMIRQIKENNFKGAIETVKNDIALPAILGRICSAPCENACIHKLYDSALSICKLKRVVADIDLEKEQPYKPQIEEETNHKVAVFGAGPTGLSAAYYLRRHGHQVSLFDKFEHPGGMMKYGVPPERLDKQVLAREIEQILNLDIPFKGQVELGKDLHMDQLTREYDAVVLAIGTVDSNNLQLPEIEFSAKGVAVGKNNFQTNIPKVFAGGNTIRPGRSTIRSCAHGKLLAQSVTSYLKNGQAKVVNSRFNSSIGRVRKNELKEFIKGSEPHQRIEPADNDSGGLSPEESFKEAARCFHCDCRKIYDCKLRDYADQFKGNQKRYRIAERSSFERIIQHDNVIYEPGKCIKCNLCVRITEKAGEPLGLTMINRGFDIKMAVPFNASMKQALTKVAADVVHSCPTAALSFINDEKTGSKT